MQPSNLKDIRWQGDLRKRAHAFPKGARIILGKELTRIQIGLQPRDGDWLTSVGRGVQEIRIAYSKEAYRVVYVASIGDCIVRVARLPQEVESWHRDSAAGAGHREAALS